MNKVVLITGASRGIGAATAKLAAAQGYDVAVNYLRDAKAADEVVMAVKGAGRRAGAIQGDMAREDDIARTFVAIDKELVLLRLAAEDLVVLEDEARLSGRRVLLEEMRGAEPAHPPADDDKIVGLAGIDRVEFVLRVRLVSNAMRRLDNFARVA